MRTQCFNARLLVGCLLAVVTAWSVLSQGAFAQDSPAAKILIVVGPCQHPPGTHEAAAGARLIEHCLKNAENIGPVETELLEQWPDKEDVLKDAATIVFIGDIFPPERMDNSDKIKAQLAGAMDRGCGMVCLHYATGLRGEHVAQDGDHPLLRWIGGYFATGGCTHHRSVARVCPATLVPEEESKDHPVLRGWKSFAFDDEPYWNNYFGPNGMAQNVRSLVYSMLPADNPKKETIAWAVQRADGGRGVGIVVPHYYRNWRIDDLRTLVLNSIAWSAKLDVPQEGVKSPLAELAVFKPDAVEPQPRRKKQ